MAVKKGDRLIEVTVMTGLTVLPKISAKSDSGCAGFFKKGEYHLLLQDLHLHDHEYFFKCFRMRHSKYEELLRLVSPFIRKCSLKWESIGPSERLSVTLRYLATGDRQTTIAMFFYVLTRD